MSIDIGQIIYEKNCQNTVNSIDTFAVERCAAV